MLRDFSHNRDRIRQRFEFLPIGQLFIPHVRYQRPKPYLNALNLHFLQQRKILLKTNFNYPHDFFGPFRSVIDNKL